MPSMRKEDFGCVPGRVPCTEPLAGLGIQIWARRGRPCSEIVVAFRGTDRESADDWISNFRWVTRLLPIYDQYEQVQDHMTPLLDRVSRDGCFRPGKTVVTAVGHSLGGGLAQQASYMDRRIRHVIAFDPSVVTGSSDAHVRENYARNVQGLHIERVYEHGEVLAYLRFVQRQVAPPSTCNPAVRTIRFDVVHGSVLTQHKLSAMTSAFLHWSSSRQPQMPISALAGSKPSACQS